MQYLICFSISILSLMILNKAKSLGVILVFCAVIIAVLMPPILDIENYMIRYVNSYNTSDMSFGYDALSEICRSLGFNFSGFYTLCILMGTIIVLFCYRRLTSVPTAAMALFVVYPFMFTLGQIRIGLGSAFILASFTALVCFKKCRTLCFWGFYFIAISMHYALAPFAIIWFLRKRQLSQEKVARISAVLTVGCILLVITGTFDFIITFVSAFYPRAAGWSDLFEGVNVGTFCFQLSFHVIGVAMLRAGARYCLEGRATEEKCGMLRILNNINTLSFVLVPVYLINPSVYRLIRIVYMMNYSMYAETLMVGGFCPQNLVRASAYLCFALGLFILDYGIAQSGFMAIAESWVG